MKRLFTLLVGTILFATAFELADHIIVRLGMQHSMAQQYILKNLIGDFKASGEDRGGASNPGSIYAQLAAFQIPHFNRVVVANEDHAVLAKEMCAYVRSYINTREFLVSYQTARESARPTNEPPRMSDAGMAEVKKNIKKMEADLAAAKKAPGMPKEMLVQYEKALIQVKKEMGNQGGDPTPNKTKWEQMYPEDPAIVIRRRLMEYLDLAKTVDFKAQLTKKGSKMVFVNPAYEQRSLKWKAVFRAGREANDVVVAFVEEWLKGDVISKTKVSMEDF